MTGSNAQNTLAQMANVRLRRISERIASECRANRIPLNAPETRRSGTPGTVLAVCTSATISADGVNVAISHAATVACIVWPSAAPIDPN